MNLFINGKRNVSAFANGREISKICLGDVKLFPNCTFHPPTGASDDPDNEFHITPEELQKMRELNNGALIQAGPQEEEIAFTPEQQAFMNQLAEFLFPNGDDGETD